MLPADAIATLFVDMSPLATIATYTGIPLLVITIVVLLVAGPRWTRAGRERPGVTLDGTTWLGDQPTARAGAESTAEDPGGSSGRW